MVCDTITYVNKAIKEKKKVIVEGANAAMLDIDFGKKDTFVSFLRTVGYSGIPLLWDPMKCPV